MEYNINTFKNVEFKQVDVDQAIAQEREQDLRRLLKDLSELTEAQRILTEELSNWKEDVQKMDLAVELADKNMREAVFFIAESVKLDADAKVKHVAISGAVVGGIIGLIVSRSPVIGALAAAGSAFVTGLIASIRQQMVHGMVDSHLIDYFHKFSWADASKPNTTCFGCRREFSFWIWKHHCRACGGVFCAYCTGKTLDLKYPGVDKIQSGRVCDACYSRLAAHTPVDLAAQEYRYSQLKPV